MLITVIFNTGISLLNIPCSKGEKVPASIFRYGSILIAVTLNPQDFNIVPMLLEITPVEKKTLKRFIRIRESWRSLVRQNKNILRIKGLIYHTILFENAKVQLYQKLYGTVKVFVLPWYVDKWQTANQCQLQCNNLWICAYDSPHSTILILHVIIYVRFQSVWYFMRFPPTGYFMSKF